VKDLFPAVASLNVVQDINFVGQDDIGMGVEQSADHRPATLGVADEETKGRHI
jgi:hypothetical protein